MMLWHHALITSEMLNHQISVVLSHVYLTQGSEEQWHCLSVCEGTALITQGENAS